MQRVIDAHPAKEQERIALAAFVVSFATMGANLADLYDATPPKGQKWRYFRRKTTKRRRDRAEVSVALEPALVPFVEVLQRAGAKAGELWLPALHIWGSSRIANRKVLALFRWPTTEEGDQAQTRK